MWQAIRDFSSPSLDAADRVYRRWARPRMKSGRLVGFIVEVGEQPVASGCVWIVDVQPRPHWKGTKGAYLLSMFTEPDHRGEGHATRIVQAAIRWAKARGISVMLLHASPYGESLYARLGFERTTEMRKFLTEGPRNPVRSRGKRSVD
jgi:GNAT superfamily N-acetyltransferase